MRLARTLSAFLPALLLALCGTALATTIPRDLEARAAALRGQASPAVLSWVHDQAAALAKRAGPVDVSTVEANARSSWAVLGRMEGADIEALAFLVLMDAAKSSQDDLRAVMSDVKSFNAAKVQRRETLGSEHLTAARLRTSAPTPTPTPAPDRVAQFVAAARSVEGRTRGAVGLSRIVRR